MWLRYPGQPWHLEWGPYPRSDDDRLTLCGGVMDAAQIQKRRYARVGQRCLDCQGMVATYNARMDTRYKLR
jgi:hypothetical protein